MVQITKTMSQKHRDTLSAYVESFVKEATALPLHELPKKLATFPTRWPFPKGDLYHWVPLLNRFDTDLEAFVTTYELNKGPQTKHFGCDLLEKGGATRDQLFDLGFSTDGDREVVEQVLYFSRILLENCGNRSIYGSSPYLSDLLNSTSLSLLASTLQIGHQLAKRYQASFKRIGHHHRSVNATLLANHYNIDLDRVQQLCLPFSKTITTVEPAATTAPNTPATPKGKEKGYFSVPAAPPRTTTVTTYANDLAALVKSGSQNGKRTQATNTNWAEWGGVRLSYYETASKEDKETVAAPTASGAPITPTPARRASTLGRGSRESAADVSHATPSRSATVPMMLPETPKPRLPVDEQVGSTLKIVEIPGSKIVETPTHDILRETLSDVPETSKYTLLAKVRTAKALSGSLETRRQMLAVRLLAITNLAYIYSDSVFAEKLMKQDSDEPRRLQLVYQLAELIHPPAEGEEGLPRSLQTVALQTIIGLAQHASKATDICNALQTNVNHGVLLYTVRMAVAEMAKEDVGDRQTDVDEWHSAIFELLPIAMVLPRAASELINAGLVAPMVEILTMETTAAERNYPNALRMLDNMIHGTREGFDAFAALEGMEIMSKLIVKEVKRASELAAAGKSIPAEYIVAGVDYKIPWYEQESIRWLFKLTHHMMNHGGTLGQNFERLFRNLMDSPELLASLRHIILHGETFGAHAWTNAVGILNDFINNEPTSFAVIAEAGLSRAVLESVMGTEIKVDEETKPKPTAPAQAAEGASTADSAAPAQAATSPAAVSEDFGLVTAAAKDTRPHPPTQEMLDAPRPHPMAAHILQNPEAIAIIPESFGAICLSNSGMKMFLESNALDSFMEIFESPAHINVMEQDGNLPHALGSGFDELMRHHPPLKQSIMNATLDMVARVAHYCKKETAEKKLGAKLMTRDSTGKVVIADRGLIGNGTVTEANADVDMTDIDSAALTSEATTPNEKSMQPMIAYISIVAAFLGAMFVQKGPRDAFMEKGGLEYLLDLAALPIQPKTVPEERAHRNMQTTIASLADHKPHLVIPSLMKRTQAAADALLGFAQYNGTEAYFATFVHDSTNSTGKASDTVLASGSSLAEALLTVTNLTGALYQCLSAPSYNARTVIGGSFGALNLGDYWTRLVKSLGPILAASAKEDFKLSKMVPRSWRRTARAQVIPARDGGVENILPSEDTTRDALDQLLPAAGATSSVAAITTDITPEQVEAMKTATLPTPTVLTDEEKKSPEYQNWSDLRSLFSKIMPIIPKFLQALGKVLIGKRAPEPYQRMVNTKIADAIAETVLSQFNNIGDERSSEVFTFWDFMLGVTKSILVNDSVNAERPGEIIVFILMAFMRYHGFTTVNRILDIYGEEIRVNADKLVKPDDVELLLRNDLATLGIRNILDLYTPLSYGKYIADSSQSNGLTHRAPPVDKGHPDFYSAGQLVIEVRMAILPAVERIWDSEVLEKGSRIIPSRLINILRHIMFQDHETNFFKRSDPAIAKQKATKKRFRIDGDALDKVKKEFEDQDLAKEALFRCNNDTTKAIEYCKAQKLERSGGRNRVAYDEIEVVRVSDGSTGTATPAVSSRLGNDGDQDPADLERQRQILALIGTVIAEAGPPPGAVHHASGPVASVPVPSGEQTSLPERAHTPAANVQTIGEQNIVTIEDLNEERAKMQEDLIDRCLEVVSSYSNLTFEVSDLIFTVISKAKDPKEMRSQVGETLVGALASFMYSDDIRAVGKKIASYAHLLAILLQNKDFYSASVEELSSSLGSLLEFVKLSPDHKSEESSPWIAHILLIVEILLCNDAEPLETEWKVPTLETKTIEKPVLKQREPVVPAVHREKLFDSILEILPRIGKDESLALAVLRILVILTRSRKIATAMGEKKNMQRLFVTVKQLSVINSTRVQSPLMLILRHIIEDDETVKQIMRAEIKTFLDPQPARTSRHPDIVTYLRSLSHLVDRNPKLFVEITNEMVRLRSWNSSPNAAESARLQVELQDKWKPSKTAKPGSFEDILNKAKVAEKAKDEASTDEVKPSTEEASKEEAAKAEHKPPVVENPDGVIHFLLSELLNYRDVEDMEVTAPGATTAAPTTEPVEVDAAGPSTPATPAEPASPSAKTDGKKPKQEFKLEDHPIYLYRCFLLQCLTELLASYNRTKIEFIHFKRNAPTHAATPSKPRSDVVKYLLYDLIPTGCLEHPETTAQRKRAATSSFADGVLTALLSKTGEQILELKKEHMYSDDEPDLLFVRKFVLEGILKVYKEASAGTEPLDQKYSRMLSLANLMNHIMSSKDALCGSDQNVLKANERQLKRIMFEKGFLGALTASIADIDLNFPGAKRAVKHILRPLKALTQTAVDLSELGQVALMPGDGVEEEIESASSVSEVDEDDREETPDLFRNSTLGMFEPDREGDSTDEEDEDEEMYDEDGYEEEYDEEDIDPEGPLSDMDEEEEQDEDIDGMGPIEGLDGDHNHDVEVIMDIDEDDEGSESSTDDDDDDEDMDDEDDDNRVEIIDEHGNVQPLEALDDEDNEWESEEDEEEDDDDEEFHERLVEEEELRRGGESLGHGALGHLIHSFADGPGGDVQGDIDNILQRLGDGTAGPMGILDEFMVDEHDHEHDEDDEEDDEDEEEDDEMDDEEDDMYQNYELAGQHAGMPFALEFDGGDGVPPVPVFVSRIGGRRMGGRLMDAPAFPFIPGGPRDPLGGMLGAGLPGRMYRQALRSAFDGVFSVGVGEPPVRIPASIWNPSRGPGHHRGARIGEGAPSPSRIYANEYYSGYEYGYPPSRRHPVGSRGAPDSGTNPLLQRGSFVPPAPATPSPFMNRGQLFDLVAGRGIPPGSYGQGPQGILNEIFQHMPLPVGSLPPVRGEVHIRGVPGLEAPVSSRDFRAMFGLHPPPAARTGERSPASDPGVVPFFNPEKTINRWGEEARMLFGVHKSNDAAAKLAMAVFAALGPAAFEAYKEQQAKQKEAAEKAGKEEEERKAKQAKDEEERLAKEKKEAEEKAEADRKKAEEEAAEAASNPPPAPEEPSAQPMEGVEATGADETPAGEAAADRPRIEIPFRDGTLDITDLGIDLEYLDALPEEYREEVITGAIAQRRSEAAAAGAPTSEIDQEFLDALPEEIRAEIMAQERADRRRREREEARRAAGANGGAAPAPAEMEPADFLNSLPADMRAEAIAMAANDPEVAGAIPEELLEQARRLYPDMGNLGRVVRAMEGARPGRSAETAPKPVRRPVVQMLDKAGIATLLRLMFVYQQDSLRNTLHAVLLNVSENRHNRSEIISTILHILQDGSADMTAIEKSFAHLSVRAKQPKEKEPKTPLTLSRKSTATAINAVTSVANADISPLMVVQQCLAALIYLARINLHLPSFFLSEHEQSPGSLKRALSKKGKGKGKENTKEERAAKFPINSLLNLLDRHLIIESSPAMESLSYLLSDLTKSLPALERRQKESEEAAKKEAEAAAKKAEEKKGKPTKEKPEEKFEEASAGSPMDTDAPAPAGGDANASTEVAKPDEAEKTKEADKKKPKPFVPPVIPDSNLKLLVNIFVARECSAKTFRDTLSTIKNLSCLPGAKSVFGKELIIKAQELRQAILVDLEELVPQIQKASNSTELQGVALAKFSPSGSDQNKLLRVLTALDHLFTPKPKKEGETEEGDVDNEKRDLLASLYQNSTFGSMWDKLSACLTAIRQRENMLNVATILLPLIESLMVVCKNTDLKDPVAAKPAKQLALTSPVPEGRMESLFYSFTEEHRKIMNDLVRNNPKLMSGTFSLLVKNPKVLEFDNKRNFFTRNVHNRSQQRQPYPPLQLSIRRDQVFHDSFKSLYFKTGDEMKFGKLSIRFHGEEGIDAGGVSREWFQALSRQMFDPSYALFIPVSSDRTTFHPNMASGINEEHLMFFKFIGRIIGKALYEGRVLDCHFSRAVYKKILGKSVSVKDMESLDPDYYKSITWMLENDITDIITETFSVDNDKFGVIETKDLIPNGRNIAVTEENKHEYVRLMVEFKLIGSVQEQLDHFLKGFHEIIPAELIAIFDEQELELLISGLPEIDVDDWKANTEYHQYTAASPQIQWFWRALRSFDDEEKAKMLQFVTGTSKVPLNGFKELEGMNGFSRFNIHRDYGNKDRLPTSHTCFNQLDLPEYESYEMLRQQLLTAITTGADHFGFA